MPISEPCMMRARLCSSYVHQVRLCLGMTTMSWLWPWAWLCFFMQGRAKSCKYACTPYEHTRAKVVTQPVLNLSMFVLELQWHIYEIFNAYLNAIIVYMLLICQDWYCMKLKVICEKDDVLCWKCEVSMWWKVCPCGDHVMCIMKYLELWSINCTITRYFLET